MCCFVRVSEYRGKCRRREPDRRPKDPSLGTDRAGPKLEGDEFETEELAERWATVRADFAIR